MLFQPRQPPPNFSAFRALSSRVVCWCLWKEPVWWWWGKDADLETVTDRVTADAWSDHHWQPQPCRQSSAWWSSPPPCWRVLVAALPRWSAGRLSTHQSSCLQLEYMVLYPAWCCRCDSPVGSNLGELEGQSSLLNEPVCFQLVLLDARILRNGGCLGWNSIILSLSYIFHPNLVINGTFDCSTVV